MQFWQYIALAAAVFLSGIAGVFLAKIANEELDELRTRIRYACELIIIAIAMVFVQLAFKLGWQLSAIATIIAAILLYAFDRDGKAHAPLERYGVILALFLALAIYFSSSAIIATLIAAYYLLSSTIYFKTKEPMMKSIMQRASRDIYFPLFAIIAYIIFTLI